MGKRNRRTISNPMRAWANLVISIVETLQDHGTPVHRIYYFLSLLEDLNGQSLTGDAARLADSTVAICRLRVEITAGASDAAR